LSDVELAEFWSFVGKKTYYAVSRVDSSFLVAPGVTFDAGVARWWSGARPSVRVATVRCFDYSTIRPFDKSTFRQVVVVKRW
jgi:hypothetical protein